MAEGQGRSSGQGVKLLYIRDYLHKYTNKEHPKNAREISEYLASKGIKADRKTIYNDILRLQMDFQEPIAYSHKKGYYISKPQFEADELLMLLDCVRFADFITDEETKRLVTKVKAIASAYDRELLATVAPEEISVLKPELSIYVNLRILLDALRQRRKICFKISDYVAERSYTAKPLIASFVASPHRLVLENGRYRLYYSLDRKELIQTIEAVMPPDTKGLWDSVIRQNENIYQSHEVALLSDILILDTPSIYAKDKQIDVRREAEEALDEMHGPKRAITIWFSYKVLDRVAHDLGSDAILLPDGRKGFQTTIRNRAEPELFKWIASFGGNAKILTPADVEEMCSKYIERCSRLRK